MKNIDFDGKKILVIGASSGIGEKIARELDSLGATTILVARREDRMKDLLSSFTNPDAFCVQFDVNNLNEIPELMDSIVAKTDKLDGLVFCAGITEQYPVKMTTPEIMKRVMNTNFFSFFETARQFARTKYSNDGARIVAISSMASIKPCGGQAAYASSKAAMDASILCIAKELRKRNINVNSIRPATVKTEMTDNAYSENILEDTQILGMLETSDVAGVVVFLLSKYGDKYTGRNINIDAGLLL